MQKGERIGKLVLISRIRAGKHSYWECRCDCGESKKIRADALSGGQTKSCGCGMKATQFVLGSDPINKINWLYPGMRFGRLVVLSRMPSREKQSFNCKCDCGVEKCIDAPALVAGTIVSCGCFGREQRLLAITTHGLTKHYLYPIYHAIRRRCCNPKDKHYHDYGGRGIGLYADWVGEDGFIKFYQYVMASVGDRPEGRCDSGSMSRWSLDRIDNNKGYEPSNLRWATQSTQMKNTRRGKCLSGYSVQELMEELSKRQAAKEELPKWEVQSASCSVA